jgi:hypothetical protein
MDTRGFQHIAMFFATCYQAGKQNLLPKVFTPIIGDAPLTPVKQTAEIRRVPYLDDIRLCYCN